MPPRLSKSQRLRRKVEEAELVRRAHALVLPPKAEAPACPKHPDWKPTRRILGQPHHPAAMCPHCQHERDHPPIVEVRVEHPMNTKRTPAMDSAYDAYREKFIDLGHPVPGSLAERQALNRIDELRARDRRDEGRVVLQRIERGQIVHYVAPHRNGRRGALGLRRVVL